MITTFSHQGQPIKNPLRGAARLHRSAAGFTWTPWTGPSQGRRRPKSRRDGSKVPLAEGLGIFSGKKSWGILTSPTKRPAFGRAFGRMRILTWEFWGTGRNHTPKERSNLPNELELKNHNVSQLAYGILIPNSTDCWAGTAPWNPGNLLLD